jgi:hypothetical protein
MFNFSKRKKKLQTKQLDKESERFLQMLIKMKAKRPNFNIRRVMLLVYPDLRLAIDDLIDIVIKKNTKQ